MDKQTRNGDKYVEVIFNALDAMILVTDPETDVILYANDKMNAAYGVNGDPVGKRCYEVYQKDQSGRCDFCALNRLADNPDVPVEWETFNTASGKWFRNRDSMVEWTDGRKAHLQYGVDITWAKNTESLLHQRLKQQELMSDITSGIITSNQDVDTLIADAVGAVGAFAGVDRIFLARFDKNGETATLRASWRRDEAFRLEGTRRLSPGMRSLKEAFLGERRDYVACGDVAKDPAYISMLDDGVGGFLYVPIVLDGVPTHCLGLEMCSRPFPILESDVFLATTLGNIVAGMLSEETSRREVKAAEEQTQLMLDAMPLSCTFFDERFRIIDCNQAAVDMYGLSGKNEVRRSFFEYAPVRQPDGTLSGEMLSGKIREASERGHTTFRWMHHSKDGEEIPTEVMLVRVNWKGGYRIVSYARDLRVELAAKEEARTAEERTQIMLDATPLASYFINHDGQIVDCNQEAVRLFGAESKKQLMELFYASFSPEYQYDGEKSEDKAIRLVRRAFAEGELQFEWIHRLGNGEMVPMEVTLKRAMWKGSPHVAGYARDLRSVKRAESELKQRSRLLETVNIIANNLMQANQDTLERVIANSLEILGQGTNVGGIRLWRNVEVDGRLCYRQTFAWPEKEADGEPIPYDAVPHWKRTILSGDVVNGSVEDLPPEERARLVAAGVRSILAIPLLIDGKAEGFACFEDKHEARVFSTLEEHVMRSGSTLIATVMLRLEATREMLRTNADLIKKRRLLIAVNDVAKIILGSEKGDFPHVVQKSLRVLGESVGADRVSMWENHAGGDGGPVGVRLPGWIKGKSYEESATRHTMPLGEIWPDWARPAKRHADVNRSVEELPPAARHSPILRGVKSLLLIPLYMRNRFWGFVGFSHDDAAFRFSGEERNILRSGSMMIAEAIIRNQITDVLAEAEVMAATDPLTGLLNRASFRQGAEKLFNSRRSRDEPLSVVFFDLDHFKKVNDTYGHAFGDEVLIRFAEIARQSTRPSDLLSRHGGEEFLAAIPANDERESVMVCERIMKAVKEARFDSHPSFRFTVSIGMESCVPDAGDSLEEMIKRADQALYEAKRRGRDRLLRYEEIDREKPEEAIV